MSLVSYVGGSSGASAIGPAVVTTVDTTTTDGLKLCTADNTTDTITCAAHGWSNGDRVGFAGTTTYPTGLNGTTMYYVINAAANTFQVSLTSGGAAVNFTTNGASVCVGKITTLFSIALSTHDQYVLDFALSCSTTGTLIRSGYWVQNISFRRTAGNISSSTRQGFVQQNGNNKFNVFTGIDIGTQTAIIGAYGSSVETTRWLGYITYIRIKS